MNWVNRKESVVYFQAWNGFASSLHNRDVWRMAFYAIVWPLWLTRNDLVFKGKKWDGCQIFDLVKVRMAWWVHARWPQSNVSVNELVRTSNAGVVSRKVGKKRNTEAWKKPQNGWLKFNIDKASEGNLRQSSIRGILEIATWVSNPNEIPWRMKKEIIQIHQLLAKVSEWKISHTLRSTNEEADLLAKGGCTTIEFIVG
ncbi:Uncharacterized protein TCM_022634 [Theobroma cacao]|uniref:RNase H type-1 domain-containing protein n=1 Tax=Theobroma cacao TaxID=3641 RepID=A0A061EU11_THECC|nr:Uncharacterized protein TCM_022634 [Theobroma cacao]